MTQSTRPVRSVLYIPGSKERALDKARGLPAEIGWEARARDIELTAMSATEAVQAFADGEVRVVLGGTIADFLLTDRTGLSRGALRVGVMP